MLDDWMKYRREVYPSYFSVMEPHTPQYETPSYSPPSPPLPPEPDYYGYPQMSMPQPQPYQYPHQQYPMLSPPTAPDYGYPSVMTTPFSAQYTSQVPLSTWNYQQDTAHSPLPIHSLQHPQWQYQSGLLRPYSEQEVFDEMPVKKEARGSPNCEVLLLDEMHLRGVLAREDEGSEDNQYASQENEVKEIDQARKSSGPMDDLKDDEAVSKVIGDSDDNDEQAEYGAQNVVEHGSHRTPLQDDGSHGKDLKEDSVPDEDAQFESEDEHLEHKLKEVVDVIKIASSRILWLISLPLVGSGCVSVFTQNCRLKNVQVALRAKWPGSPELLEAWELLSKQSNNLFWEFTDLWLQPDRGSDCLTAPCCVKNFVDDGLLLLSKQSGSIYEFSLSLRSTSPRLVLYRQLAEESLTSYPIDDDGKHSKFTMEMIESIADRTVMSSNPKNPGGSCCWVNARSTLLFSVPEVVTWLYRIASKLLHPKNLVPFDEIGSAISKKTHAILINTPHYPNGKVFNQQELEAIASLCIENDVLTFCNEVYDKLEVEDDHISLAFLLGMYERTMTLSSLGKVFSFTRWKIGWAIAPVHLTWSVRLVMIWDPGPLISNISPRQYQSVAKLISSTTSLRETPMISIRLYQYVSEYCWPHTPTSNKGQIVEDKKLMWNCRSNNDHTTRMWDPGKFQKEIQNKIHVGDTLQFISPKEADIAMNDSGTMLLSGGTEKVVHVWDPGIVQYSKGSNSAV